MPQFIHHFANVDVAEIAADAPTADGDLTAARRLLGGKGANLAEMTRLGLPVPPGFVVTTDACHAVLDEGGLPEAIWGQVTAAVRELEHTTGKRYGAGPIPLLVAVRSGAAVSMPGMMDTILNVGMTPTVVEQLAELTGDRRFAYDSYRRLIQGFGATVLGVDPGAFESLLTDARRDADVERDDELSADALAALAESFQTVIAEQGTRPFPTDPWAQLRMGVEAVFASWRAKRAVDYRNAVGIDHGLGTAVNVVSMVFGNTGSASGTGVVMSRNGTTGAPQLEGDFLVNAQGEDVVSGVRATTPIDRLGESFPEAAAELARVAELLEGHYRDMQDIEFTIEHGRLWLLQTRSGKRTPCAAVRIAVDLVDEGLISRDEALARVSTEQLEALLHPQFPPAVTDDREPLASGLNVSPGAAVGRVTFDPDRCVEWAESGEQVVLVRPETKPEDVHGMLAAAGILTSTGGRTSHAALVARQFAKPAVAGAADVQVDVANRQARIGGRAITEGDWLSIDGTTGSVYLGRLDTTAPALDDPTVVRFLDWADEVRTLGVRANVDTAEEATVARGLGADGVGLCRTEHMFFDPERLALMQRMITAREPSVRRALTYRLLPYQRADFTALFEAMDGLPVVIRLLDPPLHEFLPQRDDLEAEAASLRDRLESGDGEPVGRLEEALATATSTIEAVDELSEANPMLGLRGVRLGIVQPDLTAMQARAIFEAAVAAVGNGCSPQPAIMVPLVSHGNEFAAQRALIDAVATQVAADTGVEIEYKVGVMIEVPRAALVADEIARHADFFSFGTNDLTQTTFAMSRDDAEKAFVADYIDQGILDANPFTTLDVGGVGRLVRHAHDLGREANAGLETGICGEHGGDPASIDYFHDVGLAYVSCSAYRVPVARLAAAQAALGAG
ncbi:MAG: pyruvate, phosphate dikinase [Actinomycetota bacterium]